MPDSKRPTQERSGQCLCGAVTITAKNASTHVGACHCEMCRRWGGGPYMEIDCGTDVDFTGADNIGVYSSSDWAERGFCKTCGSNLFYRLKETGQCMVAVGLFTDDSELSFEGQVFVDQKPGYYEFANKTQNLTGAEVFAMFGGSDEEG